MSINTTTMSTTSLTSNAVAMGTRTLRRMLAVVLAAMLLTAVSVEVMDSGRAAVSAVTSGAAVQTAIADTAGFRARGGMADSAGVRGGWVTDSTWTRGSWR